MPSVNSLIDGILKGAFYVIPALSQEKTNGVSLLGTLNAPTLQPFLTNNPLPYGYPWGKRTSIGTNPNDIPNTGVIRKYDFTIKRSVVAPDGYEKPAILINGQFPGPQIEANWGDTIQVTVRNQITGPEEGTSLHWHGLLQRETPWFDGVPSVQQCPIAPGGKFTYTFKADSYGTSWYHAHYSAQYSDGAFGPMIIHGPAHPLKHDVDLGPVFLSDWYHLPYRRVVEGIFVPFGKPDFNPAPYSDNQLINGKMNFDCSTKPANDTNKCTSNAGISKFRFKKGKTYKLRLINSGAADLTRFSIDGHNLTVVANDYTPIQPYITKVVTLGVGQRADVLVTANQGDSKSAFWMRSNASIAVPCANSHQPFAVAAVYYDSADTTKAPTSTAWDVPDPGQCRNDPLEVTVPLYPIKPAAVPSLTKNVDITFGINASNNFEYYLDGQHFRANYNNPVLLLANQGNLTYEADWNVRNFGTNESIRLIINNLSLAGHPMHLHGHNFHVVHEGMGNYDGVSVINPENPQRRDTQQVAASGHIVIQYENDNPGVWPLHCHIAWHASHGLYINFLERPNDIKNHMKIPAIMAQTCRDWWAYTKSDVVDQIDSGL
ncbi:multicopper oxidase-domain-containing protein [Bisporella sp. PMI_857]|nr:multicopper oxidase-domain-containing protein [Bisporella sp. PMI_857]